MDASGHESAEQQRRGFIVVTNALSVAAARRFYRLEE